MSTPLRITVTLAATALAAVGLVPTATASAPTREELAVNTDEVFTDWCSFPVRLQETGKVIILTSTGSGDVVRETVVAPEYRGTLTNQLTGAQLAVAYPGGLHITYYADGSHTTRGTGPTVIAPPLPSPATGTLGLWLVRGQFQFEVAADGTVTSTSFSGSQVDLCKALSQ
jgi:hypothetical protein